MRSVRPKRSEGMLRRRREPREGHDRQAPAGQTREQRSRERGPLQDHALYSCGCGYVFEAPVSTTVGCPHCGGRQAW